MRRVSEVTSRSPLAALTRDGAPFTLVLREGSAARPLQAQSILRFLADRRIVCRGVVDGRPVVAKLYFPNRRGRREYARELDGLAALAGARLPAPRIMGTAEVEGGGSAVLLEPIEGAVPADAAFRNATDDRARERIIERLIQTLGAQHAAGLFQRDLHPGNFLIEADRLWSLDGAGIERVRVPVPLWRALPALALLLAQFPPEWEESSGLFLSTYWRERGHRGANRFAGRFARALGRQRRKRIARRLRKVFRECQDIVCERRGTRQVFVHRESLTPALSALIDDPDRSLRDGAGTRLKDGHSSTVWRVSVDGRDLVVKRDNRTGLSRMLRRLLRQSRSERAWRNGERLAFCGIAAVRPVAMVRPALPGSGAGWVVSPWVDGQPLNEALAQADDEGRRAMARDIAQLLRRMARSGIRHGDLKASNILIGPGGPVLLDIEAVRAFRCGLLARRASRRDVERLLRNFDGSPGLRALFERAIDAVGLAR